MAEEITCPKCGITPQHPECDGDGRIYIDDFNTRPCPRMRSKIIRYHLGPEISGVQHVKNGKCPLLEMDKPGLPPKLDRTGENLWLRIRWRNLLPHLKFALGCKGAEFFFSVITDQQIKNVFVGNEHYRARTLSYREDEPVYNSLSDLVAAYDLVVIKLGYIGHTNRAAAGALKEVLLIREATNKAVWIVEDPEHPWTYSRDSDVEHYIQSRFEKVSIDPADPGPNYRDPEDDLGIEALEEDDFGTQEESHQEERYQESPSRPLDVKFDLPGDKSGGRYR